MEKKRKERYIYWVEKITFPEVLFFIFKGIFSCLTVKFDENKITKSAAFILNILSKVNLGNIFQRASLSLNKKDADGYALAYRMEEDLDFCLEQFCQLYLPEEETWFIKMAKSYLASEVLQEKVAFIAMAQFKSRQTQSSCEKNILFIVRHPVNLAIIPYYSSKGIILKQSFSFLNHLKPCLLPFAYLFFAGFCKIYRRKIKTDIKEPLPAIWIEYVEKGAVNYLFWLPKIEKKGYDIVFYLDRADTPVCKKITLEIEKEGFKWIDGHTGALMQAADIPITALIRLLLKFLFPRRKLAVCLRIVTFRYKLFFEIYKSIYDNFKVKMLFQHQINSWKQQAQSNAIEETGGIMVGYNRSNFFYFPEAIHLLADHVYFVWGKALFEWAKYKGNSCRYILPSGVWLEPSGSIFKESETLIKDIDFKFAIFDSGFAYNVYQSAETLSLFYIKVLEFLEKNKTWAGIVKSKNWDKSDDFKCLPEGGIIAGKLKSLMNEGRILILPCRYSPATAAVNSGLSLCYGFNSAGIIAGTYSARAIHWDCSGWLKYPVYNDKEQRIIFQSLEEFLQAAGEAASGNKKIGDFSRWKKYFNHFDDMLAAKRVGGFIQHFMKNIQVRENAFEALDSAAKEYIQENNIEDNFFVLPEFWRDKNNSLNDSWKLLNV